MKNKGTRSTGDLATLDDFLKGEGKLEEFEAVAVKEVLAWQIGEAEKVRSHSRKYRGTATQRPASQKDRVRRGAPRG